MKSSKIKIIPVFLLVGICFCACSSETKAERELREAEKTAEKAEESYQRVLNRSLQTQDYLNRMQEIESELQYLDPGTTTYRRLVSEYNEIVSTLTEWYPEVEQYVHY